VALELPIGEEEALHGIADVLSDQAFEYDPDGQHHTVSLPSEIADEEHRVHDELVEEIVSGDDDQLERYLSGEIPTTAELERTLAHEVLDCLEFPVLVGSALTGVGIDRLADFICEIGPSPASSADNGHRRHRGGAGSRRRRRAAVGVCVQDTGRPVRRAGVVVQGGVRHDRPRRPPHRQHDRRRGAPARSVLHARQGAAAVLEGSRRRHRGRRQAHQHHDGTTLAPRNMPVQVVGTQPAPPVFGLALKPVTQTDDDKLSGALHRLLAEDPNLSVERNHAHQTVLSGTGDTHLAVALERLARKFGVRVETEDIKVPYRETVVGTGDAEGKVKKQSGGHGQYAVANLRVSPLERGAGFEFVDSIVGGAIPRNYIPAVQKGIEEAMQTGGAHGFPVVDVRVECYDGKYHSVDSSDMAFKNAAATGFKEALGRAGAVVLEPISLLKVTIPSGYQGDVLADLTTRRGRVVGTSRVSTASKRCRRSSRRRRSSATRSTCAR
jgi:elongation factor G